MGGLAYCEAHRPCACGMMLVTDSEDAVQDFSAMPGDPDNHSRASCWRGSLEVTTRHTDRATKGGADA